MNRFLEIVESSRGEAVLYGPTRGLRIPAVRQKGAQMDDASLDNLGTLIFFCDVGKIIANNKEQMEADHSALFVYTNENMIYQDMQEDLPPLPEDQGSQGYRT